MLKAHLCRRISYPSISSYDVFADCTGSHQLLWAVPIIAYHSICFAATRSELHCKVVRRIQGARSAKSVINGCAVANSAGGWHTTQRQYFRGSNCASYLSLCLFYLPHNMLRNSSARWYDNVQNAGSKFTFNGNHTSPGTLASWIFSWDIIFLILKLWCSFLLVFVLVGHTLGSLEPVLGVYRHLSDRKWRTGTTACLGVPCPVPGLTQWRTHRMGTMKS